MSTFSPKDLVFAIVRITEGDYTDGGIYIFPEHDLGFEGHLDCPEIDEFLVTEAEGIYSSELPDEVVTAKLEALGATRSQELHDIWFEALS